MAIDQSRGSGSRSSGPSEAGAQKPRGYLMMYIQETWTELKKTTWPTKQEATRLTGVVIGVIIVLGIYMGLLDLILSTIVNRFGLLK
jgi:preprotein translocase SecE subunit